MMTDGVSARRFEIFDALLALFPPGRLVDLGAGHGAFSVRAAKTGWKVTAIDARTVRWPDAPEVTWVQRDVRDAELAGYDMILCLGLFYHLTVNDQLELLKRCAGTPMIIDTHLANGLSTFTLSERVEVSGYDGRWFVEAGDRPTASWKNPESFWPTPESFYGMLSDNGYSVVTAAEPWYLPDRTFFVALPSQPRTSST
jgi:Methyltransferase domain